MELYQITQFLAFAEHQNVTKAAEDCNISQPSLSRGLKKLEEELGVPLFVRTKNTLLLNEYGRLAVQYAKDISKSVSAFKDVLQETYKLEHSINIASVAPAPLWLIEPCLQKLYPQKKITSFLGSTDEIHAKLASSDADLFIITEPIHDDKFFCKKYGTEHLYFSAPKGHRFENCKSITFKELDGETMLLFNDIGFWHEIHQKSMPNSRFLLQTQRDDFSTLVNTSNLPSFSTDITQQIGEKNPDRTDIPISDKEALATYYAVCSKKDYNMLRDFFETF